MIKLEKYKILIISVVLMIILFINAIAINVDSRTEIKYIEFTISENDTLWNIAKVVKENNVNYSKKDIREIIYEIKNINELDDSEIYENEIIYIPEI